jgi:hypothetical protein
MIDLTLTALFGVVGYLLTYGIHIPDGLEVFHILSAAGMMAGYACGNVTASHIRSPGPKISVVAAALTVCFASAMTYVVRVEAGSSNVLPIIFLGFLITTLFFSLAFLMPIAGVKLNPINTNSAGS